jgi:hypothetical protein
MPMRWHPSAIAKRYCVCWECFLPKKPASSVSAELFFGCPGFPSCRFQALISGSFQKGLSVNQTAGHQGGPRPFQQDASFAHGKTELRKRKTLNERLDQALNKPARMIATPNRFGAHFGRAARCGKRCKGSQRVATPKIKSLRDVDCGGKPGDSVAKRVQWYGECDSAQE